MVELIILEMSPNTKIALKSGVRGEINCNALKCYIYLAIDNPLQSASTHATGQPTPCYA